MSHHFEEPPNSGFIRKIREAMESPGVGLGATGNFPDGKISPNDKGEIQFAIAGDRERQLVHVDFGEKPIAFLSMTPAEAVGLAQVLIQKARETSRDPLRVVIN